MTISNIRDLREAARRRLPPFLFEYIDGGSYAERTLAANVDDLAAIPLRQRVLQDVANLDLSVDLFGTRWSMPVGLAPVGLAGMNARRGECQAVRAANDAGVPFTLSTVSACSVEEVAGAASAPFWFQLYVIKDRAFIRDVLDRARTAGCKVLVFTVDMQVAGSRYRDYRSGLNAPPGLGSSLRRMLQGITHPRWAWDVGIMGRPHTIGNVAPLLGGKSAVHDYFGWLGRNFDPGIGWKDLDFIRQEWSGPLVLKGILDPADAREAVALGADGIVVSNHGGRQLDGALSSAKALPRIADAVGNDLTVLADGGVRSGLDVLRMLALGAKGVLLGRPWAWALGAGGEAQVRRMLAIIEAELRVAMALTGVTSLDRVDGSILESA